MRFARVFFILTLSLSLTAHARQDASHCVKNLGAKPWNEQIDFAEIEHALKTEEIAEIKPRLRTRSATFLHHCFIRCSPVKTLHWPVVDLELNLS